MKVQNPIVGRAKGSAGGMTAAKVYNKNVLRAKAMEVNNPRTTAQVTQRDFFAQVQAIASTVTNEQLRSLFGIKPKAMSRRNALAAQIAEAFSIEGTTKTVDFSKLGAIGNGEKVNTPYVHFNNGVTEDNTTLTSRMLKVAEDQDPNFIVVMFDESNNKIVIINTEAKLSDVKKTSSLVTDIDPTFTGYAYVTCDSKGEDVSDKGFGSFIIKVRPEKKGRDINKPVPTRGVTITLSGTTIGSTVELDFSAYDYNNLVPGRFDQGAEDMFSPLVTQSDWVKGESNIWTAELLDPYNLSSEHKLEIKQGYNLLDTITPIIVVE